MMAEQLSAVDQTDKCVEDIPVPPTPQVIKSSSEILSELFGAFNATPPSLTDITITTEINQSACGKKHKKQSKKKSKKVKKKKRSSSSNSKGSRESKKKLKKHNSKHSASESESVKLKKKKRKLGKYSASDSDSDESLKIKKKKLDNKSSLRKHKNSSVNIKQEKECSNTIPDLIQENILKHAVSKIVDKVIDSTKLQNQVADRVSSCQSDNTKPQNQVIDIVSSCQDDIKHLNETTKIVVKREQRSPEQLKRNDDNIKKVSSNNNGILNEDTEQIALESKETEIDHKDDEPNTKESDKPKLMTGKIKIQNLKFSQVYEATVKQIEEEAKRKAEKYEEGEISGTTSEEKSPSPSLPSSSESLTGIVISVPVEKKKKHRHHHKKEKCHRHRRRSREEHRSRSKEKHRSHSGSHHKRKSRSRERLTEDKSKSRSRERSRDRRKKWSHRRDKSRSYTPERSKDITKENKKSTSHERDKEKRKHRRRSMSMDRNNDRTREKRNRNRSRSRDGSKDWIVNRRRSKERSRSLEKMKNRKNEMEESDERSKSLEKSKGTTKDKNRSKETSKNSGHEHSDYEKDKIKRGSDEKIDKQKLLEIARKNALSMMKSGSGRVEQNKMVSITAGGKTVSELTDFCKLLSQKDAEGHESISSDTSSGCESENGRAFHHPFQLKDRNASIVLNIRNSVALPVKSLQEKTAEQARELRLQFPVSSGQHHRKTEREWVPVSPKKPEPLAITAPPPPVPSVRKKRTFTDTPMIEWPETRQQPLESIGQFTGSTGVKVLTQAELASGHQAWARRDQLQVAAPVNSGMGMTLLQKMGWRPGEGLGKNKEGALQPLLLEVKTDKKGLVAQEELPVRQTHQIIRRTQKSLEGKHPVSLLNEYCSRRRYSSPQFELIDEAGPDHKKNFRFKVKVNGIEYTPAVGSPKKKQARAEAAEICLKELGILPMMR